MESNSVQRLQLGISRLENLTPEALEIFLDKSWIHFGDVEHHPLSLDRLSFSYIFQVLTKSSFKKTITKIGNKIFKLTGKSTKEAKEDYYKRTNFKEFYYEKGDKLPFDNDSVDFIYSEHFFEHLFFDEALSLLRECHRILKPNGVIRTCVPDADLRTYAPPEPAGYPDVKLPWNHPSKNKIRWSVYSFSEALKIANLFPIPLFYCDKSGQYICNEPTSHQTDYEDCTDADMIFNFNYIMKKRSLIVDGIKH
ncbi:class I SAM-dependent methyltransferase [Calothrix rhizosoleniae]|uniref:class I SAM-dependent methyltransferase n=1 Tax=Calothrix rhizosoleniae TaxID=888997 RepID=UPI000B4A523A|nr:methyltransferase domain-containing protein [Calothrix rhizosoleniae]